LNLAEQIGIAAAGLSQEGIALRRGALQGFLE